MEAAAISRAKICWLSSINLTKSCTRTHTATLVFVYVAVLQIYTKTLSALCSGELGVSWIGVVPFWWLGASGLSS